MEIRRHSHFSDFSADDWQKISDPDDPFTSYGFLAALEESGAVGGSENNHTGWQPFYLSLQDSETTLWGALPSYLKFHSSGEYVFDQSWAEAYQRAGGQYYPKLQVSIPFTPAPGTRLLTQPGQAGPGQAEIDHRLTLLAGLQQITDQNNLSSAHITFVTEDEYHLAPAETWLKRMGLQYHWQNQGFGDFEDFLSCLTSRKRKAIRKERKAFETSDLTIRHLRGNEITPAYWDRFYQFYLDTTDRKWAHAYLPRLFFERLHAHLSDQVLLIAVMDCTGEMVAAALNLIGGHSLYGRYWGCQADYKFLHFETCYYQSQEFAIQEKLATVQAGAQGEHKIQRGYLPVPTYSLHYIGHPEFRQAVERFLRQERHHVQQAITELASQGPYRQSDQS